MKFYKVFSILVLLFVSSFQIVAQDQSPVVQNVTFSQRTDGSFLVDIYYDVNDPESSTMTVSMQVSSDNGTTWDFSCNNITGEVGSGIISGTNKHIVWDFGSEHPQTFGDQFRIKIIADDGEIVTGIPCPGIETVEYEGKIYNTVLIGTQCWLRENLDIGTRIDGIQEQTDNSTIEKYCYGDNPANCTTYGGLYQWSEAMQYVTNEGAKGICPTGWHIPTYDELQTLVAAVTNDGNALKREDQGSGAGQGTNTSGFSALLAGYRYDDGNFSSLGYFAGFWSSTEGDATTANYLNLDLNDSGISLDYGNRGLRF